ncbi:hypothetical protein L6R49_22875 [Myxococcota bacterium]|nr:hypothetical protein [Myxococcota bacterium]
MLFLGNSYTFMGGLDEVTLALFLAGGGDVTATRLAEPGMRFVQHVAEIEREGSPWHTAFQSPQDWVFLQEQSQIPGFPEGQADLEESRAAAVALDGYAAGIGAQTMFVMTWGRRDGDSQNPDLYPDFVTMQAALAEGYTTYVAQASADGSPAWLAPAGLAWARVYEDELAAGADPLAVGGPFHALYIEDGSHPSERGTYLTACVIYASVTGLSPAGLPAPEAVTDAAYLQSVAAEVVLSGEGVDYPWETPDDTEAPDDTDDSAAPGDSGATDDSARPDPVAPAEHEGCGCAQAPTGALQTLCVALTGLLVTRRRAA